MNNIPSAINKDDINFITTESVVDFATEMKGGNGFNEIDAIQTEMIQKPNLTGGADPTLTTEYFNTENPSVEKVNQYFDNKLAGFDVKELAVSDPNQEVVTEWLMKQISK